MYFIELTEKFTAILKQIQDRKNPPQRFFIPLCIGAKTTCLDALQLAGTVVALHQLDADFDIYSYCHDFTLNASSREGYRKIGHLLRNLTSKYRGNNKGLDADTIRKNERELLEEFLDISWEKFKANYLPAESNADELITSVSSFSDLFKLDSLSQQDLIVAKRLFVERQMQIKDGVSAIVTDFYEQNKDKDYTLESSRKFAIDEVIRELQFREETAKLRSVLKKPHIRKDIRNISVVRSQPEWLAAKQAFDDFMTLTWADYKAKYLSSATSPRYQPFVGVMKATGKPIKEKMLIGDNEAAEEVFNKVRNEIEASIAVVSQEFYDRHKENGYTLKYCKSYITNESIDLLWAMWPSEQFKNKKSVKECILYRGIQNEVAHKIYKYAGLMGYSIGSKEFIEKLAFTGERMEQSSKDLFPAPAPEIEAPSINKSPSISIKQKAPAVSSLIAYDNSPPSDEDVAPNRLVSGKDMIELVYESALEVYSSKPDFTWEKTIQSDSVRNAVETMAKDVISVLDRMRDRQKEISNKDVLEEIGRVSEKNNVPEVVTKEMLQVMKEKMEAGQPKKKGMHIIFNDLPAGDVDEVNTSRERASSSPKRRRRGDSRLSSSPKSKSTDDESLLSSPKISSTNRKSLSREGDKNKQRESAVAPLPFSSSQDLFNREKYRERINSDKFPRLVIGASRQQHGFFENQSSITNPAATFSQPSSRPSRSSIPESVLTAKAKTSGSVSKNSGSGEQEQE